MHDFQEVRLGYGIFRLILTPPPPPPSPHPPEHPNGNLEISMGPNVTNRPPWMYPTHIQPRSIDIQPFGAIIWPEIPDLWPFQANFDPPGPPDGNFGGSKCHQQTILYVSHPNPAVDPAIWAIWSHQGRLWPAIPHIRNSWVIWTIFGSRA